MDEIRVTRADGVATILLSRGKVHALNESTLDRLGHALSDVEHDPDVRAVVLGAEGPFFSFGFDIPELLGYDRAGFTRFVGNFTRLYTFLYLFPKPVVAALNGHTVAGGCMLALACDLRLMATGKARIALNEIGFGSSVFAGSVEMLRAVVGTRRAETVLFSGALYSAEEALELGLVDRVTAAEATLAEAQRAAAEMGARDTVAFGGLKRLVRGPIVQEMARNEPDSIRSFVEIWYSDSTWSNLQKIEIR